MFAHEYGCIFRVHRARHLCAWNGKDSQLDDVGVYGTDTRVVTMVVAHNSSYKMLSLRHRIIDVERDHLVLANKSEETGLHVSYVLP